MIEFLFGVAQGAAVAFVVWVGLPLLAVRAYSGARPSGRHSSKKEQ